MSVATSHCGDLKVVLPRLRTLELNVIRGSTFGDYQSCFLAALLNSNPTVEYLRVKGTPGKLSFSSSVLPNLRAIFYHDSDTTVSDILQLSSLTVTRPLVLLRVAIPESLDRSCLIKILPVIGHTLRCLEIECDRADFRWSLPELKEIVQSNTLRSLEELGFLTSSPNKWLQRLDIGDLVSMPHS